MYQLVYSSIAYRQLSKQNIADLLLSSQAENLELGITGCIMFHGNEFIHILEGEEEKIKKLYNKISNDPRHKHVTPLYQQLVSERCFKESFVSSKALSAELADKNNVLTVDQIKAKLTCDTVAVKLFGKMVELLTDKN